MASTNANSEKVDVSLLQPHYPDDPMHEPVRGSRRPDSPYDPPPAEPKPSKTQSPGINRPPKAPTGILGPYIHFRDTTPDRQWRGSVLIMYPRGTSAPTLKFDYDVSQRATTLYEDVFNMTAIRIDISLPIPDGFGDLKVTWTMDHQGRTSSNTFHVAKWDQKWRGGFFSCNGFDETVPQETVELLGFDNVWKHLNSVHEEAPMHVLIWGGDQIYIDFIFEDIPFLKRWLKFDWDKKWSHEFSEETSRQVAEYYFNTYHETWERDEVRRALQTMPSMMMWDDHDIFDGAGSYPPELHDSPVMLGLFRSAKKMRLLFQMHTTETLAAEHGYFGVQSQNVVAQAGPRLGFVVFDGRSERNHLQVHAKESVDMVFENMDKRLAPTTQQLIVVFAVPFSFIRVRAAEKIFGLLAQRQPWVRKLPGLKGLNSIFDLPEFYDDLLDEWCHESHIAERNDLLSRLQAFAKRRSIRITFFSGDVHCAAFAMFRSDAHYRRTHDLKPENDHRLMYQVISSAIVNQAPSKNACIGYHYIGNSWHPIEGTDESLVDMFERRPEQGKQVRHRRVLPNRNWTFFEEVGGMGGYGSSTDPSTHNVYQNGTNSDEGDKHHGMPWHKHNDEVRGLQWHRAHYAFDKKKGYPSTLGPVSAPNGTGVLDEPLHVHHHGLFCHHKRSKMIHVKGSQLQTGKIEEKGNESHDLSSGLRIRMWLESRRKESAGRQFASYETVVPNLVSLDKVKGQS